MLENLLLENFMSFHEQTNIPLAPLTLILGPNSSGKSTIGRALRVLRDFSMGNPQLAPAPDLAYGNIEWMIRIGLEFTNTTVRLEEPYLLGWDQGEEVYSEPRLDSTSTRERVTFSFNAENDQLFLFDIDGVSENFGWYRWTYDFEDVDPYRTQPEHWTSDADQQFWFGESNSRLVPFATDSAGDPNRILLAGPRAAHALVSSVQTVPAIREIPPQLRRHGHELDGQTQTAESRAVNHWFERFGIPYTYSVELLSSSRASSNQVDSSYSDQPARNFSAIRQFLVDRRTGAEVWLDQVGTGIGQVIPVITRCAELPDLAKGPKIEFDLLGNPQISGPRRSSATLLVEQPELHLHPRMQAELGSLFAETVWAQTLDWLDEIEIRRTGVQLIVETHSEHLILRIQRLIREGRIPASDVSLLYISIEEGTSRVNQIRLDDVGNFVDEWPDGFFDERLNEILGEDQ